MIQVGKPSVRFAALALVATAVVGSAVADMVYDDEASTKASATQQSQQMTPAPTSVEVKNVINAADAVSTAPVVSEAPKIQKASEKSREKRAFQESTNNELVVQKLEERRLKQEEKLTAEINKRFTIENDEAAGTPAPTLKEETVAKPIQDAPGTDSYQMSAAPKGSSAVVQPIQSDRVAIYQSSATSAYPATGISLTTSEAPKSKTGVSVIPRAGLATLSSSYFNMSPKYMLGVGLGFDVSDHVGVELGYSYSEIGVRYTEPYIYGGYNYAPTNELNFKNNTFDAGLKFYLTDLDAKVRPYVGGGLAYSTGTINYNEQLQQQFAASYQWYRASDYNLAQFQGMAQAGLDLKVAPNISLGAAYKFLKPISSNESEEGLGYGYFYGQPVDPTKQAFRGQIRDSNVSVYQISASVTF